MLKMARCTVRPPIIIITSDMKWSLSLNEIIEKIVSRKLKAMKDGF